MKFFKKIKKGFTLVELVVVIAVIAILSGVGVGTYIAVTNNAKQSAANQEAVQLKTAIQVQSISTWNRAAADGDSAELSVAINWKGPEKCIEIKGVDSKVDAMKALDDLVSNSEGLAPKSSTEPSGYTWTKNDSGRFEFLASSSTDKFLITVPEGDDNIVIDMSKKIVVIKTLMLKHTNGCDAVVLDSTTF